MTLRNASHIRVGTAGWSIPKACDPLFSGSGTHLERYAQKFNCAEINTSFYRSHRQTTYAAWAAQTPTAFRFSVKLPRAITHDGRLRRVRKPLEQFLEEIAGLGTRLGVVLVQLPPSLPFEARPVRNFFELFRALHNGAIACEPRHASWFTKSAETVLCNLHISRVAADPARWPAARSPGGFMDSLKNGSGNCLYHRWHGSPRMYWSRYPSPWINARAAEAVALPGEADRWCIFDNTAGGGALPNALEFQVRCKGAWLAFVRA